MPDTPSTSEDTSKNDSAANVPPAEGVEELTEATSQLQATEKTEEDDIDRPDPLTVKRDQLDAEGEASAQVETVPSEDVPSDSLYVSAKKFEDLPISEALLTGLYNEMNFQTPSHIQAETLPMLLTPPFRNLIAQAHNGSGKTTCFVLGMLSRIDPTKQVPQTLCLCHVRELVVQNVSVLERMGKYTKITCASALPMGNRNTGRKEKVIDQCVIGTPGTVKNWINNKVLSVKDICMLVFDEADYMFAEGGHLTDTIQIIKKVEKSAVGLQKVLFSATYNDTVMKFVQTNVKNSNKVFVRKEDLSLEVITQRRVDCPKESDKDDVLCKRIIPLADKLGQTVIFTRTKKRCRELHEKLKSDGWTCSSIHGDLSHQERDAVITEFIKGVTKIMISTDILARGFDNRNITLVINYDLPVNFSGEPEPETYMHRVGRSGRFGQKGAAFNLVHTRKDASILESIFKYYKRDLASVPYDDEEAFRQVLVDAGLASKEEDD